MKMSQTNARPQEQSVSPMPLTIPKGIETNCSPNSRGIVAWEHVDRKGKSYMFCTTDLGSGRGMQLLNDKISFLSVPVGMRAQVYEHANGGGISKTYGPGEYEFEKYAFGKNYSNTELKDKISGIRVFGKPPKAVKESDAGGYVSVFDFETDPPTS